MLKINYDPSGNKGQEDFHRSQAMYKAMVGALGSGKTATLCVEGILLSMEFPGNVGLIARNSLPELKTTTLKRFFEFLPEPAIIRWNKTDRELLIRTQGNKPSLIHFGPLDELGRYKSLELGWFGVDEADQMTEDMWLTLCGRLRLKGVRYAAMLATNPTSTRHWIYKRFVESPPQGYEVFRSKTLDNAKYLPDGYVDQLKNNYPEDWQRRYLEGEFGVIQEGDPVFPDFKPTTHSRLTKHIPGRTIMRGWDFGYHHPCVVFAEFDDLQRLRVLRTVLGEDEDLEDSFAPRIIRYSNDQFLGAKFEDFCDPSGVQKKDSGKPSISILNNLRIYPRFRQARVEERVMELRKLMRLQIEGEPAFQIDPTNHYLIEGFLGGYQYGKKKEGEVSDEPKKDGFFDHGQDALGYIIANTCMMGVSTQTFSDFDIPEPNWVMNG